MNNSIRSFKPLTPEHQQRLKFSSLKTFREGEGTFGEEGFRPDANNFHLFFHNATYDNLGRLKRKTPFFLRFQESYPMVTKKIMAEVTLAKKRESLKRDDKLLNFLFAVYNKAVEFVSQDDKGVFNNDGTLNTWYLIQ